MMQFWREIQISGDPDGADPPDGAGAGGHLGGGASIRSSPDGQDKAIDTPSIVLPVLGAKIGRDLIPFFNIRQIL